MRRFARALIRTILSRLCCPGAAFFLQHRDPADIEADVRAAMPPRRREPSQDPTPPPMPLA